MPDIAATRPSSGAAVEAAWGAQVHDLVEGVQAGTVNVVWTAASISAVAAVVFPRPYATPPIVVMTSTHAHYTISATGLATATGFSCQGRRTDGTNQTLTLTCTWVAVGTPA